MKTVNKDVCVVKSSPHAGKILLESIMDVSVKQPVKDDKFSE